jgi:hypothetical protein
MPIDELLQKLDPDIRAAAEEGVRALLKAQTISVSPDPK